LGFFEVSQKESLSLIVMMTSLILEIFLSFHINQELFLSEYPI